jgi:HD-like signal output (HDOD) protein
MELRTLLASQFVLPSIPKVIALLLTELKHDEPDLKKITQLISTDPALTTRLLRLSNSRFFKLSGKINSVTESLALLGLNHVRTMVTEAASAASFKAVPGINLQQFWSYSLNVAKLSRSLAGWCAKTSRLRSPAA